MSQMRYSYNILVGYSEGKRPFGVLSIHGRRILEWNIDKYGVRMWSGITWPKTE